MKGNGVIITFQDYDERMVSAIWGDSATFGFFLSYSNLSIIYLSFAVSKWDIAL